MVKKKQIIGVCLFICLIAFLYSCSLGLVWDSGHRVDGQYVPKKPNYKLKDKENNIIPPNLDTVNIYREISTESGKFRSNRYLKFYPEGRLLEASTLQEIYPDSTASEVYVHTFHGYYYSKDGEKIQTEEFVNTNDTWPVSGMYKIDNYHLNATGDTLTMQNPKSDYIIIYVKEKIPRVLEDYPVNW